MAKEKKESPKMEKMENKMPKKMKGKRMTSDGYMKK